MNSKYVYAFAGLLLGMTACSNEDLTSQSGKYNGETVFVSLNVGRSKDNTRTIIEEVDVTDGVGLSNFWATGDQVTLVAADGRVAGTLTLQGEGGSSEGVFSGEATVTEGDYTVWYLGDARKGNPYAKFNDQGNFVNALAVSGCEVSGDFSDLNKGDLMKSTVQIKVKDGKATVAQDVTLVSQMAMAHFTLSMDGLETALTADDANMTLSYIVDETPYSYSITNKKADVFVPLFPGKYAPSFTLTSGGKTYTYAFANTNNVQAGLYYCGAKGTDGNSTGIGVTLIESTDDDDIYKEYANEDPRNPLHKFAKYNLVRVGERGSLVNGFADSETENGALYQWGRNHGYMDDKGVYINPEGLYLENTDFINYADAQGLMTYDIEKGEAFADFYVYQADQEKSQNFYLTTGMGAYYNSTYGDYFFDRPRTYSTLEELRNNPTKYFMNATIKSAFKSGGPYALMWENEECVSDYWLDSFKEEGKKADGGKTWTARATVSGYENPNPCPAGWRIPTLAEMKAIAPEGNGIDQRTTLQSALASINTGKVRSYEGVKYAIRWIYDVDYLQIECVVDESLTKDSDLSALYWDNHINDKVVRKFPYTGAIAPLNIQYMSMTNEFMRPQQIVRPYFRGVELAYYNYDYWLLTLPNGINVQTIKNKPGDFQNTNGSFGGYWVEEKNYALKFMAGEKYGTSVDDCYLFVGSAEPVMGYAIRPVMDN